MHCTMCGHVDAGAQNYCRRCGTKLPAAEEAEALRQATGRLGAMITFNVLSAVSALASVIMLYATYLDTPEIKWSIYVAGALCTVIAAHQSVSFAFALQLRHRLLRERKIREDAGTSADSAIAALPAADTSRFVNIPSVTEATTAKLRVPKT